MKDAAKGASGQTPAADNQPEKGQVRRPFTVSHQMVIGLAIPMTLAYMTTPLLGVVDTGVVGRLNDAAMIGGLAVGSIIIDLIFTSFNFLRAGTTGLTAQAVGAEDDKEAQAILLRALLVALVAGIAMIVLAPLVLWLGLFFLKPGEAVASATSTYFLWRILATPFSLSNYAILGWLIGLGRATTGLGLQILINGTNIVFSVFLGLYMGWGIAGVAFGTVIGEAAGLVAGALICAKLANPGSRPSRARILTKAAFKRLLGLNIDIMIRSFILVLAFAFITAKGAEFGELTLAANAILMHFFIMAGYFLDGLATAAEQIVGRAIGARYKPAFVDGLKLSAFWSALLALLLTGIYFIFGEQLVGLLTTLENVRSEALFYLPWAALTPLSGALAFQMDGVFIGATWSREMSKMMILSFIIFLLVWWVSHETLGNSAIWLSLHAFLISRGITLSVRLPGNLNRSFILKD